MKKLPLLLPLTLFAGAITITNDSPYTLTATVFSNANIQLGSMTIGTNESVTWEDTSYGTYQPGVINAPYSVIWTCSSGADYGVSYNIGDAATTSAQESAGARYCQEKNPKAGP